MPRRNSHLSRANPSTSILHVSKSSPTVESSRHVTVEASRSRKRRPRGERKMVANRDRAAARREPYLIHELGTNLTPRPLSDPAFQAASDRAFAGLPAARPLRPTLSTLQSERASARSSAHSMMSGSRFSMTQRYSRASAAFSLVSGGLASPSEISWASEARSDSGSDSDRAPSLFRLREDPPPARPPPRTTFSVSLTETETMFLLDLPSRSEPAASAEGAAIAEANSARERAAGAGRTVSHTAAQTDRVFRKHRRLFAPRATRRNASAWATVWDIYDAHDRAATGGAAPSAEVGREGRVDDAVATVAKEEDCYDAEFEYLGLGKRFLDALMVMERLVAKAEFRESQLQFRLPPPQDPLSLHVKFDYTLRTLWTFADPGTAGRCVTSLCWSRVDGNVLAVGYGKFGYTTDKRDGLVCLWNAKNPASPERRYRFDEPVTFVAFSDARSHVLAVAFYSGRVLLIDVVSRAAAVKATNDAYPLHRPVWQARWFPSDDDARGRFLVTCGGDGRVYRYRKTEFFVSKKLLTLVRPHGEVRGVARPRECRARKTLSTRGPSAEVLAPHPADTRRYLVGTSEGYVYDCSADRRHGHADAFVAHDGPVYDVRFSPFCARVFLTCGADWRVRVWAEAVHEPLATLECGAEAVLCAAWDPARSTVIACGAGDRLRLWDLWRGAAAPKGGAAEPGGARVSALAFAGGPAFALGAGDAGGRVRVVALAGMPFAPAFQERALAEAICRLLVTRPATLARLRELGPPFTPERAAELRSGRRPGRPVVDAL